MTPKEAFRIGFLRRCAEMGLDGGGIAKLAQVGLARVKEAKKDDSPVSLLSGIGKSMTEGLGKTIVGIPGAAAGAVQSAGSGLLSGAGMLGQYGLLGLALGPPALGAAAGYGLARATDIDDEDVDSVKQQELIDEYRRSAAQLQHRNRTYRVANRSPLRR
jgi:hypothetical protein